MERLGIVVIFHISLCVLLIKVFSLRSIASDCLSLFPLRLLLLLLPLNLDNFFPMSFLSKDMRLLHIFFNDFVLFLAQLILLALLPLLLFLVVLQLLCFFVLLSYRGRHSS